MYDADGGLLGELRYAWGKTFRHAHCSLCDLTHRGLRMRAEWKQMVERLGVPVRLVHRNEIDDDLAKATDGRLPCVVARHGERLELLLGPDDLAACDRDARALERRIRAAASS